MCLKLKRRLAAKCTKHMKVSPDPACPLGCCRNLLDCRWKSSKTAWLNTDDNRDMKIINLTLWTRVQRINNIIKQPQYDAHVTYDTWCNKHWRLEEPHQVMNRGCLGGLGRIQERIVVQKPGDRGVQLLFLLHICFHADVFVGDQRRLLPLQPVSHHVTFPLLETNIFRVLLGSSRCSRTKWASHLDLQHSSALQQVTTDLLQQVKGTGAALDLQGWKNTTYC